jgi:outer membrane lipoprotein-sorting protein
MTLAFIVIAALIVACAAPPADGTAPVDTAPDTVEETAPETPVDNSADPKSEFLKYFSKSSAEWKVDYALTNTVSGETEKSTMRQFLKGEDRLRMDFVADGQEVRMYFVEKTYTMCTNDGEWQCLKFDTPEGAEQSNPALDFSESIEEDATGYDFDLMTPRTIAGTTALCFKVVEIDVRANAEYCFSKEGVPLYMKVSGSDESGSFESEMIATSFSKSVSASDFTPPAEAQDLSALYGGMGYPTG